VASVRAGRQNAPVASELVELNLGTIPSPAGSAELLLVDEWSCRLVFLPTTALPGRPRTGVATFARCRQAVFGYPNDEARRGHPLYRKCSYGFYEVIGSDWPRRLEALNRVTFPDTTSGWDTARHFVVACHERLVEVLADDVSLEVDERPFDEVAVDALRRNLHDQR
jgi:hypothetical protein